MASSIGRFLDIEAGVDDDEFNNSDMEEDEEGLEADNFIDDKEPFANISRPQTIPWNHLYDGDTFLEDLLTRAHQRSQPRRAETPQHDLDDRIAELPHSDDYPLWRVRCRIGIEEEAVQYLFTVANEDDQLRSQLRSAFTRGSIRGWVYLEANMNADLMRLLARTPGIVNTRQGIIQHKIDPDDWIKMLAMHNPKTVIRKGDWVRVGKGRYKGDVGLAAQVEYWGVQVLLVPRLTPPTMIDSLKRKRPLFYPKPELFDLNVFWSLYKIEPRYRGGKVYTAQGLRFEYGLLQKAYDFHSLSPAASIPSNLFFLFQLSGNPLVLASTFPCPQEWIFEVGDSVVIRSSGQRGTITAILPSHLEVCRGPDLGDMAVQWPDVRKAINIGDFVEVASGHQRGTNGWVVGINEEIVQIVDRAVDNIADPIKPFEVHINWLKIITVPFLHAPTVLHSTDELSKANQIPWIGTSVTIIQQGHPQKGYSAVVKNVLPRQTTPSGLKVVAQFLHSSPANPFQTIIIDYDHVVETNSGKQLFVYNIPVDPLFHPSQDYQQPQSLPQVLRLLPSTSNSSQMLTSGGATPMPDWTSSTPAWNPLSRTPTWEPSSDTPAVLAESPIPSASSSRITSTQELSEHPFLDRRLIGVMLKANVTVEGEKSKELVVSVVEVNGRLKIQHVLYNSATYLVPNQVSPKHPNATRDNGLLIVIKGEHCGKYVRRIHHRHDKGNTFMILAVVGRVTSAMDTLQEERLELTVDFLCVGWETKEDKKLNNSLMTSLREEARRR